jgi:hypothetical protein
MADLFDPVLPESVLKRIEQGQIFFSVYIFIKYCLQAKRKDFSQFLNFKFVYKSWQHFLPFLIPKRLQTPKTLAA